MRAAPSTGVTVITTGADSVPAQGPALLVCNPVSHLDWLFLVRSLQRPVRCVVFGGEAPGWLLRRIFRWTGAISITGTAAADDGVDISNGLIESTGTASITIEGTTTGLGDGVDLFGSDLGGPHTIVTSVAGAITIEGTASSGNGVLLSQAEIISDSGLVDTPEGRFFHWCWLRLGGAHLMLNTTYDEGERPTERDSARQAAHDDTGLYFDCPDPDAAARQTIETFRRVFR